jgi:hypothetical protein
LDFQDSQGVKMTASKVNFVDGAKKAAAGGLSLITFAWAMEIMGVTGGAINSAYMTFGGEWQEWPKTIFGYVPAIPMVALAAAELGRVPLASSFYSKCFLIQLIAIIGIFSLGYIAIENWTFSFERIVDLRLKIVNAASRDAQLAISEASGLREQQSQLRENSEAKRNELRDGLAQRNANIADLTVQLAKDADIHQKNLEGIREACRIVRDKCIVPRSQEEDARYREVAQKRTAEIEQYRAEQLHLQSEIDQLVQADAQALAELGRKIATADEIVNQTKKTFQSAADGNQIYRLAANWYRVSTRDVTPEQFAAARWAFSTISAIAVALAGTVAALVHYASDRDASYRSRIFGAISSFSRAGRAYYARKRKPIKVEVPGPERIIYRDGKEQVVVEKEVVRFIDKIVLIPRWGIHRPFFVNALVRKAEQRPDTQCEDGTGDQIASKVTQMKKAH